MNQLNQLQKKLDAHLISNHEQGNLKGGRGRIFRGGSFPFDNSNDVETTKGTASSGSIINTTTSSPTTSPTPSTSGGVVKFGKTRIV